MALEWKDNVPDDNHPDFHPLPNLDEQGQDINRPILKITSTPENAASKLIKSREVYTNNKDPNPTPAEIRKMANLWVQAEVRRHYSPAQPAPLICLVFFKN